MICSECSINVRNVRSNVRNVRQMFEMFEKCSKMISSQCWVCSVLGMIKMFECWVRLGMWQGGISSKWYIQKCSINVQNVQNVQSNVQNVQNVRVLDLFGVHRNVQKVSRVITNALTRLLSDFFCMVHHSHRHDQPPVVKLSSSFHLMTGHTFP